jgi:uncharacterized protein (TIGR03086 family)
MPAERSSVEVDGVMPMNDIRDLDRRAVVASAAVAMRVTPEQLSRPTPCAGWSVADLLAHMTAQHLGFAAAARGGGADLSVWQPVASDMDPVSAYVAASDEVVAAFAEPGVLERQLSLPEISTETTFAGAQAVSFHFVDYVVHTWDLARAVDTPIDLDQDLLDVALEVAERVPGGEARLRPGAAFAPALPEPESDGTLDRILTLLGRSPRWPEV